MQGIQKSQNNLEKEQSWKTHTFYFKIYYTVTVFKRVLYEHKH